jgi:hypothetical protein
MRTQDHETAKINFSKHILMRVVESLTSWPKRIPEATLTARSRRQKPGVIKLMTPPPPPDENMVRRLNALAAKQPFCKQHRVKKHDTL